MTDGRVSGADATEAASGAGRVDSSHAAERAKAYIDAEKRDPWAQTEAAQIMEGLLERIAFFEHAVGSWKAEEADWVRERDALLAALRQAEADRERMRGEWQASFERSGQVVADLKLELARAEADLEHQSERRKFWRDEHDAVLVRAKAAEEQLARAEADRDEAREIVEQLRRHGADWVVEKLVAVEAERVRLETDCLRLQTALRELRQWIPADDCEAARLIDRALSAGEVPGSTGDPE